VPDKAGLTREQIISFVPQVVREIIDRYPGQLWDELEEIRLRLGRPLTLHGRKGKMFLSTQGYNVSPEAAYCPDGEDLERALHLISSSSLYAFEQELRCGYITIPGGHRVGLCGQAVLEQGRVVRLKHITALNYRVAREIVGAAKPYVRYFVDYRRRRVRHALIISPPRCGKTTFLRDLARCLSDGAAELGFSGFQVGIVDERSELAGSFQGQPQLNVGRCTDVLDACPKAEGMMMLLRSMAPQVIITDEIGLEEDVRAVEEVSCAGVTIIATVHAGSLEELRSRPGLRRLLEMHMIERLLFLGRSRGPGFVELILEPGSGKIIYGGSDDRAAI